MSQVLIASTSHPMYSIKMLSPTTFIVAGGGGATKSGVPNSLQIFSLNVVNPDAPAVVSVEESGKIDTGVKAVMNFDLVCAPNAKGKVLLATGQDDVCEIFEGTQELNYIINDQHVPFPAVLNSQNKVDLKTCRKTIDFSFTRLFSLQSVSSPDGKHFQKSVCWAPDGLLMATGGSDGYLRIWDWANRQTVAVQQVFNNHSVDSVSISPDGTKVLTVGESGGQLWLTNTGQKFADIPVVPVKPPTYKGAPVKYKYRLGQFFRLAVRNPVFVTVSIRVNLKAEGAPSFATQWAVKESECRPIMCVPITTSNIYAMAISDDCEHLAFGTADGSVVVVDSSHMTRVKLFDKVHKTFVTGVEFVPDVHNDLPTRLAPFFHQNSCGVLSVSADNSIQLHGVPRNRSLMGSIDFLLLLAVYFTLISFIYNYV